MKAKVPKQSRPWIDTGKLKNPTIKSKLALQLRNRFSILEHQFTGHNHEEPIVNGAVLIDNQLWYTYNDTNEKLIITEREQAERWVEHLKEVLSTDQIRMAPSILYPWMTLWTSTWVHQQWRK